VGFVVVAGGIISCSHQGTARLPSGDPRLQVDGKPVVTEGKEAGVSFATGAATVLTPCPNPAPSGPPGSSPCTATLAAIAGVSTLLAVGGVGVLLDSATGQTVNASGPGTWRISDAGQAELTVGR
jgi:uncharacterized Zn-binding protein involved in type VI secretion